MGESNNTMTGAAQRAVSLTVEAFDDPNDAVTCLGLAAASLASELTDDDPEAGRAAFMRVMESCWDFVTEPAPEAAVAGA